MPEDPPPCAESIQDCMHFVSGEDDLVASCPACARERELFRVLSENVSIQKGECGRSLILGACGDVSIGGDRPPPPAYYTRNGGLDSKWSGRFTQLNAY